MWSRNKEEREKDTAGKAKVRLWKGHASENDEEAPRCSYLKIVFLNKC